MASILLWVLAGWAGQDDRGVELTYRLLFPADFRGDRAQAARETREILQRRLNANRSQGGYVTLKEPDNLVIRLPGVKPDALVECKKLLGASGRLELFASAPKQIQDRYNNDGKVPPGYKEWPNDEPMKGEEYSHFAGPKVLLAGKPAIEGRHVERAMPQKRLTLGGGTEWVVAFDLTKEGARVFDQAAKELFNQKPSGLIAIVLDGKILSKPVIRSEAFGGSGVIQGSFDEKGARHLASVLRHGALPVPIGSLKDGKPLPGQPESESPFVPKK